MVATIALTHLFGTLKTKFKGGLSLSLSLGSCVPVVRNGSSVCGDDAPNAANSPRQLNLGDTMSSPQPAAFAQGDVNAEGSANRRLKFVLPFQLLYGGTAIQTALDLRALVNGGQKSLAVGETRT